MLTVKWIQKRRKYKKKIFFFIKPHKFKSELKLSKRLYNRGKPISFSACEISQHAHAHVLSDEAAGWEKGETMCYRCIVNTK